MRKATIREKLFNYLLQTQSINVHEKKAFSISYKETGCLPGGWFCRLSYLRHENAHDIGKNAIMQGSLCSCCGVIFSLAFAFIHPVKEHRRRGSVTLWRQEAKPGWRKEESERLWRAGRREKKQSGEKKKNETGASKEEKEEEGRKEEWTSGESLLVSSTWPGLTRRKGSRTGNNGPWGMRKE